MKPSILIVLALAASAGCASSGDRFRALRANFVADSSQGPPPVNPDTGLTPLGEFVKTELGYIRQ